MTITAELTIADDGTPRPLDVDDLKDETVVAAVEAASTAIVSAITLARTTQSTAMAAALTELGQKLEPADITALATASNQSTEITALGTLLTEVAQKLEPADLASIATTAHQVTIEGKLDSLITEVSQKLEPADVAALSTAANQVTSNTKLDSLLTELGQKLEPADIALLATAAKQDSAKAVFDTMSTTLSNIAGYVDGLEAAEAANLAKLEQLRLLLASTLVVENASVSKGYQQLTSTAASATIASLCSGAALPTGATKVILRPTSQIRIRDDATAPTATVGYPITAGTEWAYDGDLLSALKVYGAATIDAWFYA